MIRRKEQRGGYVLVLTLGLIALASIALAGLARHSLALAASAQESVEALQERWGLVTTRQVLFDRAAEILDAQVPDKEANQPPWPKPARLSASFTLGSHEFAVTLADEDAKANLNTVYARKKDRLMQTVRRLNRNRGGGGLSILLSPARGLRSPFASWGQVFNLASFDTTGPAAALAVASREMTCWGSGRLNVRRASDAALRAIATLVLSEKEVGELIEQRRHWSGQDIEGLIRDVELRRPKQQAVKRLLAVESRHYSLWVTLQRGLKSDSYFFVDDNGPVSFAW